MKTIEQVIEYLERELMEADDVSLYWHKVYKDTQDKSGKEQAKKISDSYFDKFITLYKIMRFINDEK